MKSVWSNWKNKGKRGYCVQQAPLFFWEDHMLKTDRCSIYEIKESDLAMYEFFLQMMRYVPILVVLMIRPGQRKSSAI